MFMGPRNWFQGMNFASLSSLAGRYDNPIPLRFLAPIIDFLKIPAQLPPFSDQKIEGIQSIWIFKYLITVPIAFLLLYGAGHRLPSKTKINEISLPWKKSQTNLYQRGGTYKLPTYGCRSTYRHFVETLPNLYSMTKGGKSQLPAETCVSMGALHCT